MTIESINSQLKRTREKIVELQDKEQHLMQEKQQAEDAAAMKIIKKYRISAEKLAMLNKISEDEVKKLLAERENKKETIS